MKELLLISGLGLVAMLAEIANLRKLLYPIALLGLVALLVFVIMDWNNSEVLYGMMRMDKFALAFTGLIAVIGFCWFVMSDKYFTDKTNLSDHYALVFFATTGAVVMVSFTNMTMLFLGIEILSIPLYVLAGSRKLDVASNEASFKYFLLGAFSSGFLLLGITLVYGSTGSFDVAKIHDFIIDNGKVSGMLVTGIVFLLIALSFKVAVVPFHFWAPDVYQGSPTLVTAFMATIVKIAGFGAIFRLFTLCFSELIPVYAEEIWSICAITFIVANILAATQDNVKRMLAYSSISHAGFMFVSLLLLTNQVNQALYYYLAVYAGASLMSFWVLYLLSGNEEGSGNNLHSFDGLAKRNPFLAGVMTLALLSMAGIPPLAGFFAKYLIFYNALEAGYVWLVVLAVIGSLIGLYYYFKVIIAMFFRQSSVAPAVIEIPWAHRATLTMICISLVLLGLFPDMVVQILS